MATAVLGLENAFASLDDLPAAHVNRVSDEMELAEVQLCEITGAGCLTASDYTLSIGSGLSVDVSAGEAVVGDAGGRAIVRKTGSTNVPSLTPSSTCYIYLQRVGTFTHNTTGTPPANSILVGTATTGASTVSSVSSAPAARVNLGQMVGTVRDVGTATPGGVASAAAVGTATKYAREDHVHGLASSAADAATLEVSGGAMRIKDLGVTSAKLSAALQDSVPNVTITVGAEAANVIPVSVQARDAANNNLAERMGFLVWLGDTAHSAPSGTAPSGGWAAGTGYKARETTAGLLGEFATDANGLARVDITETGVRTWYAHVLCGSRVYVSGAITFA